VISTEHDSVDWKALLARSKLIVDTRGVYRLPDEKVIKA
jgi:UDP-N-acetyl-D-mannosaminuronate dehydrogenase